MYKPSSFILLLIIHAKSSPRINIDVYLQPLIHELKLLCDGVVVFDGCSKEYFNIQSVLRCTINDFPAYAISSGWSTKGYKACPSCADSIHSYMFGGKICYLGHWRWLPRNHPYHSQGHLFAGTEKFKDGLAAIDGIEISVQKEGVDYGLESLKRLQKGREEDDKRVLLLVKLGMIVIRTMMMLLLMMSFGLKEAYFLSCLTGRLIDWDTI